MPGLVDGSLTIRFAIGAGGGREAWPFGRDAVGLEPGALLMSYYQVAAAFEKRRDQYFNFTDYALDSGAFSARTLGVTIDLDAYTEYAGDRLANDPQCAEVFALDVIGDWRTSTTNTEAMWSAGVPAIPTYHAGEPTHVLDHLSKTYPKIALGGSVGMAQSKKLAWAEACFARVWPKPIHGLGAASEASMLRLPWHTVDATTWVIGPTGFGRWKSMPGGRIWGNSQPLRMEVDWYLAIQRRARSKWRREARMIEQMLTEEPLIA